MTSHQIPHGGNRPPGRVIVERVSPELDAGRHPIKRVIGEQVIVEADIFADGHDVLSAVLLFREADQTKWAETPLTPLGNDRWRGAVEVTRVGIAFYSIEAWVDRFKSWRQDTQKKLQAGQNVALELLAGADLLEAAAGRAQGSDAIRFREWAAQFRSESPGSLPQRALHALGDDVAEAMARHPDRRLGTRYDRELRIVVDPVLAKFGAWYEMFPRSCPGRAGSHGTFKDVEAQLPRIAGMGFDVLYFPPIHPIGRAFRKGKNNNPSCRPGEPGSPWGIGAAEGGHKAIHPELGTLEDFKHLLGTAREMKIAIALDIAFQCSPDHPYIREQPAWFKRRPDGSIQYAENPPKKYQDIYPIDFDSDDWRALWQELKSVIDFWIEQGVLVFRVDNPHTKALPFWAWMIDAVKAKHPEVIFLSEAFTRPKLMYGLARLGFTQSYNYFPWRNTKAEIIGFLTELNQAPVKDFFRPNLWLNTPDILTQYLQYGGPPAFMARLILAATLGASYGIYGPAFELCVARAIEIGSEEYLDSEKYEIKDWDLNQPGNLTDRITLVNRIRRENAALHGNDRLEFHPIDNDELIAYSKSTGDFDNVILTVVNLDPHHAQSGWLSLSLAQLGVEPETAFQVHDLLTGERYLWHGARNYVRLDPAFVSAHIFRLRRHVRSERDFDYFL